jgi:DNA polymerase-1
MVTIPDARIWKDGAILHITPEEAYENFITQALKGDPTDGYYGCKGIGEVTARKIIDKHRGTPESLWEGVVKAYKGDAEDALLNARMARILTSELYDDAPILWNPPIIDKEVA